MKHTKGNWRLLSDINYNDCYPYCSIHSKGKYITLILMDKNNSEESEANAKLIAAAPELLEALVDFKSQIPTLWGDNVADDRIKLSLMADTIERIEQAIKKATE